MRNLLPIQRRTLQINSTSVPDVPVTATAWDASTDDVICALGPLDGVVEIWRVSVSGETSLICTWDIPSEGTSCDDRILAMHYFDDSASICIIFSSGNIIIVPVAAPDQVEIVGTVDEGIMAAAWSPDEDAVAIATAASTLLLMTRNFEPIADVVLSADDVSASRHVSVGWGKSETQFKGKRAKSMRDPTVPEKVDEGDLSAKDDGAARITWRGDGSYLALSTVEGGRRRLIRVYSREGVLDSVSEPVDGLEGVLSWKPSGNLVASVQRFPDKLDVVFFERNGLRHGEFSLQIPPETVSTEMVHELCWNGDSSLLAVRLTDRIQLWSVGNYHWYLKQELMLLGCQGKTTCGMKWHQEKPLNLALNVQSTLSVHEFAWAPSIGPSRAPNDDGIVAVVDGPKLQLTPLRIANIPPPMSFRVASLKSTPLDVSVSACGSKIAVLRHSGVDLISWDLSKKVRSPEPEIFPNIVSMELEDGYRQIAFLGSDTIGLLRDELDGHSHLRTIRLDETRRLVESDVFVPLECSSACCLRTLHEPPNFIYEDQEGDVYRFNVAEGREVLVTTLPARCPWVEATSVAGEIVVFGLSENGNLYANGRHLSSSCTSFAVTEAHLIFTTNQHFLKFVHLVQSIKDLDIPPDDPTGDERCRNIERGARLVQIMPSHFSLVLEMPRGNLETIFPRALVLAGVRRSIEHKDYRTAFLACRSHRVDLNILHDHAPVQFLGSIDLFVRQVKKPEYIDLFLSHLREEDVSKTMYPEMLPQLQSNSQETSKASNAVPGKSKVDTICSAFIDVLSRIGSDESLQNIITAYVCKSPPDLESALLLIATLRDKGAELQEDAIRHICFLSDVNKLYDTSLGIYNIELALLVAQQSQKDPREYLPFLQGLLEMEENKRKFTIDDRLARFAKALVHLYAMGHEHFSDVKNYIVDKELYSEALDIYKYEPDQLKSIMSLYADYLRDHSRFREAGLAYEFLEDYKSAAELYCKAGLWQECLYAAEQGNLPPAETEALETSLADILFEAKDYESAARVHFDYRKDASEAARVLCIGNHFAEAMRLVALSKRPELLETVIDPGLLESFAQVTELLADCKGQLAAQLARLRELRQKKQEDPLLYFDGITEADAPDNVSLAPTNASTSASLFTRYTGATGATALTGETRRTSKNRRREERKRARGKKGTVYEEEYLMNSIRRLIERVNSTGPEMARLVEGMVRRRMRDRATAVQAQARELGALLQSCVDEIFTDDGAQEQLDAGAPSKPVLERFEALPIA